MAYKILKSMIELGYRIQCTTWTVRSSWIVSTERDERCHASEETMSATSDTKPMS